MTHFEYLAVMVSIILGLGIVRILGTFDEVFSRNRYWVHTVWLVSSFWLHVQNWWGFWELRTLSFSIVTYTTWVGYVSLMYLVVVCLTNKRGDAMRWEDYFYSQRRLFFAVMSISIVFAIFATKGFFDAPLLHPYRLVQAILLALAVVGFFSLNRRVHAAISVSFLVLVVVGQIIFRYLPDLFVGAA